MASKKTANPTDNGGGGGISPGMGMEAFSMKTTNTGGVVIANNEDNPQDDEAVRMLEAALHSGNGVFGVGGGGGAISQHGRFFTSQLDGRTLMLRGVNLSGSVKQPFVPRMPSHYIGKDSPDNNNGVNSNSQSSSQSFFDGKNVSFVGRPFPLEEADEHFGRLKLWGFNFLRFNVTWEAIEHEGPGIYDKEYISYVIAILLKAKQYGFRAFIDPHQDVWSRFTGGSGAPLWTLELAGFDVRNFSESFAAIVHSTHNEGRDPQNFPKMIWPTNYWKLACATMFTLFFGGATFAPLLRIGGINIQDYLQSHYFHAVAQLAQAIVETPGLGDEVVVGYDTLNEPSMGWLGIEELDELPREQELRKGLTPTPFQAMQLGMGLLCDNVEEWDMTSIGPQKMLEKTVDPKGVKAWADDGECVWARHGVWKEEGRTLLLPTYFATHPKTGKRINALRDFWKPFVNEYARVIRKVHVGTIMFVEPPVAAFPPAWEEGDAPGPLVFAPHWYDGLTLMTKHWNPWYNVDYIGFLRGKYSSVAFAVKFGEFAIKKAFQSQLKMLRVEGEDALGKCPTVFGEIGIPYDLDGKAAYLTGDYSCQTQAMDANMSALERDLLSFTLWNYTSDNSHQWGDQWNGEDLSLWSPPPLTLLRSSMIGPAGGGGPSMTMSADPSIPKPPSLPKDLNEGARALTAFVRPYPISTPGIPKSLSFDLARCTFTYSFTHPVGEDGVWDSQAQGLSSTHTEIFLPKTHFAGEAVEVYVSSGTYSVLLPHQQLLIWKCGCKHAGVGGGGSPLRGGENDSMVSEASNAPLTKGLGRVADTIVTHKIVVMRRRRDDASAGGDAGAVDGKSPAEVAQEMDEDEVEPLCPTVCSLM